MSATAQPSIK
jgi:hypothetical protein